MEVANDPSHKAVVVLDRGPKFARFAEIELQVSYKDVNSKQKKAGFSPKTLWNCALDAAHEFQRVLTDCYPNGSHCVRYAVAEGSGQYVLNNWAPVALEEDEYVQAFYERGYDAVNPELDQSSCSIMSGIELAIDGFTKPTPLQLQYFRSVAPEAGTSKSAPERTPHNLTDGVHVAETFQEIDPGTFAEGQYVDNIGTIFVITSFDKPQEDLAQLADNTLQYFVSKNRIIGEMDKSYEQVLAVGGLRVFILNIIDDDIEVETTMTHNPSIDVKFTMYNVTPKNLSSYLHRVMLEAYDLASTTIMGIPMKEETDPTKSLDYDVEVFHPRALHSQIFINFLDQTNSKTLDCGYKTICLKWCNPVLKLRKDAFGVRESSEYCTPVDILSRPTMCVVGFLKKGKHIWLEAPAFNANKIAPNMAGKLVTHVLSFDVERYGMTMTALAYGSQAASYGLQLDQCTECLGKDVYDQIESISMPMTLEDVEKIDEEKPVEIARREEHSYVDEDDPMFGIFPRCFHYGDEKDKAECHQELLDYMKEKVGIVYRRFGFEPENTTLFGSEEFLAVKNTLHGPMKPCARATHTWVRYIIDQLFADEETFRARFPRHYCMMYHGLLWLQEPQPGLFQIYFDKLFQCFDQYGVRYRVHEVLHPPPFPCKRNADGEFVIHDKLTPYCFMSMEYKFELYKNSVLIEHPIPITTNKVVDESDDEKKDDKKDRKKKESAEKEDEKMDVSGKCESESDGDSMDDDVTNAILRDAEELIDGVVRNEGQRSDDLYRY
uniref:Protein asunder n=1 Tax=Panagrellus redivivus TaxID=6233 RepID=A0A7E4W497_PANRE